MLNGVPFIDCLFDYKASVQHCVVNSTLNREVKFGFGYKFLLPLHCVFFVKDMIINEKKLMYWHFIFYDRIIFYIIFRFWCKKELKK